MGRSLLSGARRFSGLFFSRSSLTTFRPVVFSPIYHRAAFVTPARPGTFATMASADTLPGSVESLTLQSTTQKSPFPGCFPSLNPVDVYREHIATEMSKATGIDAEKIYSRLAWTNTLDKGDLTLPVCELHHSALSAAKLGSPIDGEADQSLLDIIGPCPWHQDEPSNARPGTCG